MAETLHTILMAPFGQNGNELTVIEPENAHNDYKEYIGSFQGKSFREISDAVTYMMLKQPACIAKYANAVMATITQNPDAFAHLPEDVIAACAGEKYTAKEVMLYVLSMIGGSEQTASAVSRIIESLIAEAPEKQL